MAASDHLHPLQLAMFAPGSEVKGMVSGSNDLEYGESMDQMWSRKETESRKPKDTGHGAGVYDSMKEKGYVGQNNGDSVRMNHNAIGAYLWDGHHRVAAAAALEKETGQPTWVPLIHSDTLQQKRQDAYFGPRGPQRNLPPSPPKSPALDSAIQRIVDHLR